MEKAPKLPRLLLLLSALFSFCLSSCTDQKDALDPAADPRMTLSAKLNGDSWEATGFLVQQRAANATDDAYVLIQSRRDLGQTTLHFYLYDVTAPGTYVFDGQNNGRRKNATLEKTDPATGQITFLGRGPTTFTFMRVENGRYSGTFSGQFIDELGRGTIEVSEGKFDVRVGSQGE
jgi:hypothetical protein